MKSKSLFVSTLLCLAMMITGARFGSAQQVQPLEPEWLLQMYADGWNKVQDGVLQRDAEGGVETFTYGAEGYQWAKQSLERQVSALLSRYNAYPSEDLAELIDQLKAKIAQLGEGINSAPTAEAFDGEALENCNLSWGGNSTAGPQSGTQGVTASANAYFHNDCGYVADTFATATAHAIAGTVETTKIQNDPRTGGWVDSNASASANGSVGCESRAQGQVTIWALNIFYATPERVNYNCSLPLTNSVSTYDYYTDSYSPCANVTWTAAASGGSPGYTYDWYINNAYQGSGSTLTRQYCYQNAAVTATAVARDTLGQTASASATSYVSYFNNSNPCDYDPYGPGCGGGGGCNLDPRRPDEICP